MKATQTIWVLVAGLAVGFLIGREMPRSGKGGDDTPDKVSSAPGAKAGPAAPGVIPADWITEDQFNSKEAFAGTTPAQRYTALKVLNETPCDCGCPHGSIAKCKKEDPGCPRGPEWVKQAVAMAKDGKTPEQIVAAVKKPAAAPTPEAPSAPQKIEVAAWNPIHGPKHAKVTIVEYSDFQWPFCSRVGPTLKKIEETYGKDVRIAFRHQPLPFHNHAMEAAEASMAAHAQGKFWEMHDKMFANQGALDRASLDKYAQEIGLNMAKYKADMDSHKHKANIEADSKRGNEVGASGTPAFFINGRLVSGAVPFENFKTVIDEEMKKADELLKSGTPLDKLYDKILSTLAAAPAAPAPGAAPAAPAERVEIAVGDAPFKGPKNAPITIMEFSDFQWPFCSRVGPTLKELEDSYKGKIKIAFKHQPLPFHNNAHIAAEAAMAAHEQGKFWEMHDKMFANQGALDRPSLERYAQEIGLNVDKFKSALDSGKFKAKVDADSAEGNRVGANGTPTFFINGRKLVGAVPVPQFKAIIDEELAKKK